MKIHIHVFAAFAAFAAPIAIVPSPAFADIKAQGDNGFNVVHVAVVDAAPDVIWKRLITPKAYWSKAHSWSGSVDGFTLDPRAGGCFCELIQEKDAKGKMKTIGSVEHMRVIFAQPDKVLRMQGALGPLQSEAILGTLTVAITPANEGSGTTVSFSYVVGGYMRYKISDIAPAVDKVIGEQLAGLIKPYTIIAAAEEKPAGWSLDLDGIAGDSMDAPISPVPDKSNAVTKKPALTKKPVASKPKSPPAKTPSNPSSSKPPSSKPTSKKPIAKPVDDTSR